MPETPQPDVGDSPRIDKERGFALEEDIPSDGKDEKGEQMIEELGRNQPDERSAPSTPTKETS